MPPTQLEIKFKLAQDPSRPVRQRIFLENDGSPEKKKRFPQINIIAASQNQEEP